MVRKPKDRLEFGVPVHVLEANRADDGQLV